MLFLLDLLLLLFLLVLLVGKFLAVHTEGESVGELSIVYWLRRWVSDCRSSDRLMSRAACVEFVVASLWQTWIGFTARTMRRRGFLVGGAVMLEGPKVFLSWVLMSWPGCGGGWVLLCCRFPDAGSVLRTMRRRGVDFGCR